MWNQDSIPKMSSISYQPTISQEQREGRYNGWKKAVERSFNLA